jgi:riboflavin biosynthesis pyrimidine reductase
MLREQLVEELFLTVAPKLVAGESVAITGGDALDVPAGLTLEWVLEGAGSLFLRYAAQELRFR